MIRRRLNTISFFLRLATYTLPVLSFGIAAYIRFFSGLIPLWSKGVDVIDYFGLLFFTTIVWAVVVDRYGLVNHDLFLSERRFTVTAFWACSLTYLAVMCSTFFYKSTNFSRLFVAISALALFILVLICERVFQMVLAGTRAKGNNEALILVIGADEFAHRTAQSLKQRMLLPCRVAAFVRLPGQELATSDSPVMELHDLKKSGLANAVDDVVIAVPTAQFGKLPAIMAELDSVCVPVRAVLDLGGNIHVREALFDFAGLRMLDLRASPSESVLYLVAKRTFDLAFSGVALILLSPFMGAIALAVRLTSAGPIFFVQERVGLNGTVFRMCKFRTMRVAGPDESDTRWTTADDPRRTPVGAFLRTTNLDELPQFFNVLKGEMSIVGPRPERPHFVQKFLEDVAQYNT
ncbi:MAG: exopolysaccharide biosynthesis polyprenyl glycosylphosphotransferase, partial [Terriglobia bacterium]